MLTTSPRLRIRRPSPTTSEFVVSTQPFIILHILRLLLLLAATLSLRALYPRLRVSYASFSRASLHDLWQCYDDALALAVGVTLGTVWLVTRRAGRRESLLVLRGLGVQTSEPGRTRFIPTEKIRDVLVNEAFRGFEVRYCLVVVVEGEGELVVVFPGVLPGREIVEEVWRGVRACLYEGRHGSF